VTIKYHGDSGIYGWSDAEEPGWVLAHVCEKHAGNHKKRRIRGHIIERNAILNQPTEEENDE
jgi:hypothetical protein